MEGLKNSTLIPPDPKYDTQIRIEHKKLNVTGTAESVQDLSSKKTAMKLRFHITQKRLSLTRIGIVLVSTLMREKQLLV